jgi:hypothetical protein
MILLFVPYHELTGGRQQKNRNFQIADKSPGFSLFS